MRLIAYIRVSTDDQADNGHSSSTVQPARLKAYCDLHGHLLVASIVDDGVSASVPLAKRAGGKTLLAALKAGEADGVVVVRLDRLFRSAIDGLRFFEEFADKRNVAVHSVSELIDTSTPAGRLNLTIQLAAAQYERDLAVQRATDNSRGLRKAGRVYGHVPFGCVAIAGQLYRQPVDWQVRERIVALRGEGYSFGTIRNLLRDEGAPAPAGGAWWSKATISALCDLHGELVHLPEAPAVVADDASGQTNALDTGVSNARH